MQYFPLIGGTGLVVLMAAMIAGGGRFGPEEVKEKRFLAACTVLPIINILDL